MTPPVHLNSRHAGATKTWHGSDTEHFFKKNTQDPAKLAYLEQMGWSDPTVINYKFNSHGFRCDEFKETDNFIAIGCSYTQGIGLPLELTWPALLAQKVGLTPYNLGIGGTGADTCFRLLDYYLPLLKPKFIVFLCPPEARVEILLNGEADVFLPESMSTRYNPNDFYLSNWFAHTDNYKNNRRKNILACKYLAHQHNTKILVSLVDEWPVPVEVGFARDFLHSGPVAQELFVEKTLGMLS